MTNITPYQFDIYSQQIADIYVSLEDAVFDDMVKRLKTDPELDATHVFQWQVEKLQETRQLNLETVELLSEASGVASERIESLIEEVGYGSVESIDSQVKRLGLEELSKPNGLNLVLAGYVRQAAMDIDNLVNQSLITTSFGVGSVQRTYQQVINETTALVISGNRTINQAMAQTIIKAADKGLPSGFVDRAGRRWMSEPYVATVIRNTVNNAYNELRNGRMSDYGIDLVLVNSYSSSRPACQPIQGGVCSLSNPSSNPNYPSIYEFGYGEPSGIRGINCRHILYPFVDGVSINNEEQINEEKANARYKLTQEQRYYERQIRKAKRSLHLAEESGDETAIQRSKELLRRRQGKIREFVRENDLPRFYEKERVIRTNG